MRVYAVRAGVCFDGERFVAGGATVLVDAGRIVGVELAEYELPAGCRLHDYGDATMLPGLIDTHVHLVADSGPMALDRVAGYTDEQIDAVVTPPLAITLTTSTRRSTRARTAARNCSLPATSPPR